MKKTFLKIALPLAIFLIVTFIVFLINLTVQISNFAEKFHPFVGNVVFWGLIVFYIGCGIIPCIFFLRLPKTLIPPSSEQSPEFENYLTALASRLKKNPLVNNKLITNREEIENALKILDARTDNIMKTTASEIFIVTAISQRGSLDALIVLLAQSKLIWQIAHVYYQRPSLRDMLYLYANVSATALISSEIEDIDLSEQIEPMVSVALGSAVGAIPGLQQISAIVLNSVMNGTANAFLTLRVGIITKKYCNALVVPDKRNLRKNAIAQAACMLGSIAYEGTKKITGSFLKASKNIAINKACDMGESIKDTTKTLISKIKKPKREDGSED